MIKLGKQIGSGNYRLCFAQKDTDFIVKINRKFVVKNFGNFKIPFPAFIFSFLKFGTTNPNKKEYKILMNLPKSLMTYLPEYIEYKEGYLIQSRPKDYDGQYSTSVYQYGPFKNEAFWKHIKIIENILLDNQIYPLDIFRGGGNIMIQKISEQEWKPVLIDFKRVGYRPFADSLDFKLILKSEQRKKFLQRMESFLKTFKITT